MPFRSKYIFRVTIILAIVNIFIFIFRNKGFEYVKYSDKAELYPANPNSFFFKKWATENARFSQEMLAEGKRVLRDSIGLDSLADDHKKMIKILSWIFRSFSSQAGTPADTLNKLNPLQQYYYLTGNKKEKLWCGQFQRIVGFFCTSAGFINRYIEVVPRKNDTINDYHEINEVYLPGKNKWVMVDAMQDPILIDPDKKIFSAAEYLDLKLKQESDPDKYFNKNHLLRYYHIMDPQKVYSFSDKLKRYVLPQPWYEQYDPLSRHTNFLFRVKQVFFASIVLSIILLTLTLSGSKPKSKS